MGSRKPLYRQEDLDAALQACRDPHAKISAGKAGIKFGVPKQTIRDRLNGEFVRTRYVTYYVFVPRHAYLITPRHATLVASSAASALGTRTSYIVEVLCPFYDYQKVFTITL